MAREDFNDLMMFLAVAEERSFTKAAAKLGLSQSTISHTLRRLETRLGIRLLTRTTRSVAPTEAGERLLLSLRPRVEEIEAEIDALARYRDTPAGTVRITLSDHALECIVWPKLSAVLRDYPDIKVELDSDNGLKNFVEGRYDAGVRIGESLEQDMIAVRIGPDWRLVVVGSPGYFEGAERPQSPRDLVGHSCLNMRMLGSGGLYSWEFERDGQDVKVKVSGQLTFTSVYPIRDAAIAGYGLAYLPEDVVSEYVAKGTLEIVLDEWSPTFTGYHLYYPSRRQLSPALAVIIDALRHRSA